jgi:GntR family transcriptional regulator, transcriptional repressor for pyruvate dehydrogenase complex
LVQFKPKSEGRMTAKPFATPLAFLKASPSAARLLASLRKTIAQGQWKPGERIPTERDLALQFRSARNTVRRALKILENEGRIYREVGRGTFVTLPQRHRSDDLARRIESASPVEIMEVRLIVEPQATELAAARANGAELDAMTSCLDHGEATENIADFEMWDGLFHQALIASCRNQLLIDIYDAINAVRRQAEWAALKERTMTPERRAHMQMQHRTILAALRARDARLAAAEMLKHLLDVRRNLVGSQVLLD